jgi:NAD(P)-dependent dehydrogenase (short-subunit alcohol dehydrogenase family)
VNSGLTDSRIGNSGLGKETIAQLARHRPARLYLTARNESKARDAIAAIQACLPSPADIRYLRLDLSSFKSVQAAVETFTSECDRLDVLILNAGTMANPAGMTEDGYEIQFGTNYLGHALLTRLLLPTLLKTAAPPASSSLPTPDVRVVALTSAALSICPPFDVVTSTPALIAESTWRRYAASKTAAVLFASELARRHPEILSVSLHPGGVHTGLFRSDMVASPFMKYGIMTLGPLVLSGARVGALNQLWAAGARRDLITNGAYYTPVGFIQKNNIYAKDAGLAKKLWEWTDAEFRKAGL